MKTVFVSFSVTADPRGRAYLRLLIARLSEQPSLKVWIYESPGGRIASGASIADACRDRIEASDLFIVLLTDQAVRSDFVAMEVSHAIWVGSQRRLSIYPLIVTAVPTSHWPLSLQALAGYRGQCTSLELERIDSVVLDVCLGLEVEYFPGLGDDPRLPLRHRVIQELHQQQSEGTQDIADFQRVLKRCDKAAELMAAGNSGEALKVANRLLGDFDDDYGGIQPYYLRIFRALCLLAEARAGRQRFDAAYMAFDEIVRSAPANLDANAYAGRGHALLSLGRYAEAMQDYSAAENKLLRTDPALLYSQVRAEILADEPGSLPRRKALEDALDDGLVCAQLGDSSRVAAVLALAHAHAGNVELTEGAWRRVSDVGEVGPELVCEICHWLHARAPSRQTTKALALCSQVIEQRLGVEPGPKDNDEVLLIRQRARILFGCGDSSSALRQFDLLLYRHPQHAPLYAEAALVSVHCQQFQRAAGYCAQALQIERTGDSEARIDAADWDTAIGLVYWLLGREAEARECHRRSGRGKKEWFAVTLSEQFGLARAAGLGQVPRRPFFSAI